MKKIINLCFTLVLLFGIVGCNGSGRKFPFENSNGIMITKKEYKKLQSMGFSDITIENLVEDDYLEYVDLDIAKTIKVEKYAESKKEFNSSNELVESTVTYLTKKEMDKKLNNDENSVSDYYKLTITGTHYNYFYNESERYAIKIHVELEFLKTPLNRITDIISIGFSNDVQITAEYIDDNQYAKFRSSFFYVENKEVDSDKIEQKSLVVTKDGLNWRDYSYQIDYGIGLMYDLPKNTEEIKYSNFRFTMDADFLPKWTTTTEATFSGAFLHMLESNNSISNVIGEQIAFKNLK